MLILMMAITIICSTDTAVRDSDNSSDDEDFGYDTSSTISGIYIYMTVFIFVLSICFLYPSLSVVNVILKKQMTMNHCLCISQNHPTRVRTK